MEPTARLIPRRGKEDTLVFAEQEDWSAEDAVQIVCESGWVDLEDWR